LIYLFILHTIKAICSTEQSSEKKETILQEKAENSSISVQTIMGSKNECALEFAWILGRNIKC